MAIVVVFALSLVVLHSYIKADFVVFLWATLETCCWAAADIMILFLKSSYLSIGQNSAMETIHPHHTLEPITLGIQEFFFMSKQWGSFWRIDIDSLLSSILSTDLEIKSTQIILGFQIQPVWAVRLKYTQCGQWFSIISTIQGNTMAEPLLSLLLWGYIIAIITPMCQAHTCDWVLAPGLTPSASKQWTSVVHLKLRVKPCQQRLPLTKSKKEKITDLLQQLQL